MSMTAPALRYLHLLSSRSSKKSEGREMLPTFGAGNPRRKPACLDSDLHSETEIDLAFVSEHIPNHV